MLGDSTNSTSSVSERLANARHCSLQKQKPENVTFFRKNSWFLSVPVSCHEDLFQYGMYVAINKGDPNMSHTANNFFVELVVVQSSLITFSLRNNSIS